MSIVSGGEDWIAAQVSEAAMFAFFAVCIFAIVAPRAWTQRLWRSVLPIGVALLLFPSIYMAVLGFSDYQSSKALAITLAVMCVPVLVLCGAWWRRRSTDRAAAALSAAGPSATPVQDVASPWVGRQFAAVLAKTGLGWVALLILVVTMLSGVSLVVEFIELAKSLGGSWLVVFPVLAIAGSIGMEVAVFYVMARARLKRGRQDAGVVRAATTDAPVRLGASLDRVSVAAGVTRPVLRVLEQQGVNALVMPTLGGDPEIFVTRGAIDSLSDGALEVIFANLLARVSAGVVSTSAVSDDVTASIGPADLAEINASADAATLITLRDPELVLDAMHAIALRQHRVVLPSPVSPACFYCWPHQSPPVDMPDRVKQTVSRAGAAGHMWWKDLQERRRRQADAELQ